MNGKHTRFLSRGFTIVELLVVIVVIGILAAITIVAYRGISQKAVSAALQSDLSNASRKLEIYRADNSDNYPTNLALAGIKFSGYTTDPTYSPNTDNYKTYTLTAQKSAAGGTIVYKVSNGTSPVETPNEVYASGGAITESGGYRIHTFTTVGNSTFTINNSSITSVQVLVVAGGGGGTSVSTSGFGNAGGGGTVTYSGTYPVSPGAINVTVGAGGSGGVGVGYTNGTNGGNSAFGTITATGGTGALYTQAIGGSNTNYVGGTGVQWYQGGGGAGGGGNGSTFNGGIGSPSSISGTSTNYAGGGSGCAWNGTLGLFCGTAGTGGGGVGSPGSNGSNGTVNTGGGGGGANDGFNGGGGGSGTVIVRYLIP